jgi:hypothetical protein
MSCVGRVSIPAAVLAALCAGLAACGSQANDTAKREAATATTATRGERLLSRTPYLGVACREANSLACDRVGLAVWLRRPAARVTATINGRALRLHAGRPDGRRAWYRGYLQPAGLLDGPLRVTPDRGRYFWQGSHPKDALVRIRIRRTSGKVDDASLSVPLRAGWG